MDPNAVLDQFEELVARVEKALSCTIVVDVIPPFG
jgi:hypothetical protein